MAKIPGITPEEQAIHDKLELKRKASGKVAGAVNIWRGTPADPRAMQDMIDAINLFSAAEGNGAKLEIVKGKGPKS